MKQKEMDQLSKDSTAALRAGMSYGKWKALQYEAGYRPVIQKKTEEPEANTVCRYCGKGFYARFKHKKVFCSEECNFAHQRMRRREMRDE